MIFKILVFGVHHKEREKENPERTLHLVVCPLG